MKNVLSNEEISALFMELSLLLHAGVSTGDALALLAKEGVAEDLLTGMAAQVDDGAELSAALRKSGAFPVYACGLVEVGERTGRTEEALAALSRYYEDRVRLTRRVRSALLYPAVVLALGGRLTGVAGGLLTLGIWLKGAMPVLWVLLAVLAVLAAAFTLSASFREKLVGAWRGRFGDKGVARKLNNARLAQAMSMGMASGLPVEEAVALSAKLMDAGAKERCASCRASLEQGTPLGEAMRASGFLPASQCRLLELGQRSGAGDAAMEKISRDLTEEGDAALDTLVGQVEPALVLLCSLLVGLILLSVMLPLMDIMAAIG